MQLARSTLASNTPAAARSLGLRVNPAVTLSASNINLMSGLYRPASPARGLSSPNCCVSAACWSACAAQGTEPGWQWWRWHQERQREQRAGAAKAAADDSACVGGSKGTVPPQGPAPKSSVAEIGLHLAPSAFPMPRTLSQQTLHPGKLSVSSWHTSGYAAHLFNLCYKNTAFCFWYSPQLFLNNQEWHDNYVLGSQGHPTAQRKPKVALWVAGVQTPATR